MSRTQAKKTYSLDDHVQATLGVECRKDAAVIDETPMAYKDIDAVMAAQEELVDIVHTLKQVVQARERRPQPGPACRLHEGGVPTALYAWHQLLHAFHGS